MGVVMDYDEEYIPIGGDSEYTPWVKPTLQWYPHKKRQKGVEKRIISFLRRRKSFYLETTDFEGSPVIWSVDSWGWVSDKQRNPENDFYDHTVGHIKNCLEFLGGSQRLWTGKKRSTGRIRTIKRGKGI